MPYTFPKDFLWGSATAAHQVEGGNWNSDWWELEHMPNTPVAEPSGDACDHYHRYVQDADIMQGLGFNAFRFSTEWARIEPEEGDFSNAALDHYLDVCRTLQARGIRPIVTLIHNTMPRWVAHRGGLLWDGLPEAFARYAERVSKHLREHLSWMITINEPELGILFGMRSGMNPWLSRSGLTTDAAAQKAGDLLLKAQPLVRAAIKSAAPDAKVGISLSVQEWGGDYSEEELQKFLMVQHWEGPFWEMTKGDDYLGVQAYTRTMPHHGYDPTKLETMWPPDPNITRRTTMGYEFRPQALGAAIRRAYMKTGLPMLVTENGVAAEDDADRVEYIQGALAALQTCMEEGLPVHGYLYWSLLDNFEWGLGYKMRFGLISVDRKTFERTVKPSAHLLGEIARRNGLA